MARRELPPTSRIFTKKRQWAWSRLTGSALLTASLLVMAFGIGTAVYLERPGAADGPTVTPVSAGSPPSTTATAAPAHDPVAAQAALPAPAPAPLPADLAKLEPQAGPPAPAQPPQPLPAAAPPPAVDGAAPAAPPAATAALAPPPRPSASPSPAEARADYWVEYAVYRGPLYARRLQQALARAGLPAVVVATHGRSGRALLRVRSAPLHDLAAARQEASKAEAALGLRPLLHRGSPVRTEKRYWVQFGAFHQLRQAATLQRRLAKVGVATTLFRTRGKSSKPFYLVRSRPMATHAMAAALAVRGAPIAEVASLIGVTPRAPQAIHAARAPPRPIADSR